MRRQAPRARVQRDVTHHARGVDTMPTRSANANWRAGRGTGRFPRSRPGLPAKTAPAHGSKRAGSDRGAARGGRSGLLQHGPRLRPGARRATSRRASKPPPSARSSNREPGWRRSPASCLRTRAAVPNVEPAKFQSMALATKEGCPVLNRAEGQRPDRPRRSARLTRPAAVRQRRRRPSRSRWMTSQIARHGSARRYVAIFRRTQPVARNERRHHAGSSNAARA